MKVVWTREATDDLIGVLEYIRARSPAGAASVAAAAAIDKTEKSIAQFPRAGRLDPETGCRELIVGRFSLLMIYTVGEIAEIIALFHTSRDSATKRRPSCRAIA